MAASLHLIQNQHELWYKNNEYYAAKFPGTTTNAPWNNSTSQNY